MVEHRANAASEKRERSSSFQSCPRPKKGAGGARVMYPARTAPPPVPIAIVSECATLSNESRREHRREPRVHYDDIIRWKRPGRVEDHKAWTIDRSASGLGFLVPIETDPQPGEQVNIRRFDGDRWAEINGDVRIARATPTPQGDLIMVGCTIHSDR